MFNPLIVISPESFYKRPVNNPIVVVFPDPLCPNKQNI